MEGLELKRAAARSHWYFGAFMALRPDLVARAVAGHQARRRD